MSLVGIFMSSEIGCMITNVSVHTWRQQKSNKKHIVVVRCELTFTNATNGQAIKINYIDNAWCCWEKGQRNLWVVNFSRPTTCIHLSQLTDAILINCSWHEVYSINKNAILFVLILFCRVAYVGGGDEETPMAPSTSNGRVHLFDWHTHVYPLPTLPAEIHR